jgi:polysaccharide export outer membrane protein
MMQRFWIFALLTALALTSGCATNSHHNQLARSLDAQPGFGKVERPTGIDSALLQLPRHAYRLGPGDVLELEILNRPNTRRETFILPDGTLFYDLVEALPVEELTIEELTRKLEAELSRDYASPELRVTLRKAQHQRYWVMGQVSNPGVYALQRPTTLLEALASAGGMAISAGNTRVEELADLGGSLMIRNGEYLPVNFDALVSRGDMRYNLYLQPGDYVYVPSTSGRSVYVMGAVRNPTALRYHQSLTLVEALAAAQGFNPAAHAHQGLIVRGSLHEPRAAVVDFKHVLTGQAPNFHLAPGDIVWVPNKPWNKLEQYVFTVINTAARAIAVNAGIEAIDPDANKNIGLSISADGN